MGDEITPDAIAAQASGPTLRVFARSGFGNPSRRKRNIVRLRSYHPIESAEAAVARTAGPKVKKRGLLSANWALASIQWGGIGKPLAPKRRFC